MAIGDTKLGPFRGLLPAELRKALEDEACEPDQPGDAGGGGGGATPSNVPPVNVDTATASAGVAAQVSRQDHKHTVTTAAAVELTDSTNAEGTATALARSDHTHAHGNRGGGALHANVVAGGASGFISGTDKTKLDGVTAGATNTPLSATAPADVTKSAASAGVAVEAARQDHKHDISTAAPVATGTTNAEGTATSVTRSDHVHRTLVAVQDAGTAVAARPTINVINATSVVDDAGNDRVNITVPAGGGGGSVTAGDGLVGGGALPATLDVAANADGSIVVNADDIQVGVLATDAQHGNRGGGALHADVVAAGASGFMTGADKTKLDNIATGATNTPLSNTAPVDVDGAAASAGIATEAARQDHKHDVSTAAPVATGTTNAEGTANSIARSDHVHRTLVAVEGAGVAVASRPTINFINATSVVDNGGSDRVDVDVGGGGGAGLSNNNPTTITPDDAAAPGTGTAASRDDHTHAISAAAAVELTDSTNAEGVGTSFARNDHTHSHGSRGGGTLHAAVVAAGASGFMTGADKTKLDNIATGATNTPLSSTAPVDVDAAAASAGIATEAARQDHKHDVSAAAPVAGAVAIGNAAAEGAANSLARSDHQHAVASAVPVNIGTANAEGVVATFSRSDHVHAHGNLAGGALHALASGVANGFMSAADFTKLSGIAAGAEVNAVDSVFGRTGAVVATLSDYDASQVDNDSTVTGATVANALDTLLGLIPGAAPVDSVFGRTGAVVATLSDYDASQVDNDSTVTGATVANALDTLLGLIPGPAPVTSVFGRTGVVVATLSDYDASQVDNDSTVAGATVANALDTLLGLIPGAAPVDSVFGRTGAVVAVASDYDADQVDYDDTSIDLLDSAGTAVTDVQAAIDAIALPQRIGIAESPGVSTVVGTLVYQDKIVRVFPSAVVPAGTYQLRISYGWNFDNEDFDFESQILDNGTQIGQLHTQEPKDAQNATGGIPGTGTDQTHYTYRSLQLVYVTQIAHTYTLQWATSNILHEASIWEARLELWRDA